MIIHTHVDDQLVSRNTKCKEAERIPDSLRNELHMATGKKDDFVYLARRMLVAEGKVDIAMPVKVSERTSR